MTNDNEINVDDWPDTDGGPATYWLERAYDAIDLASDRDTVTWLVKDGKRIAAIVPVDTAQEVIVMETRVAEFRSQAAHRRMTLSPVSYGAVVGLLDPDCRDGKHTSCVGGPCECVCHKPGGANFPMPTMTDIERYRYELGDKLVVSVHDGRVLTSEFAVDLRDHVAIICGVPVQDVLVVPDVNVEVVSPRQSGA